MQIPIQSLNTLHSKSYDFPFDHDVLKYNLSYDDLDEIKLVLESGEEFQFLERIVCIESEKKIVHKNREKEETKCGIDITGLLQETRSKDKKGSKFSTHQEEIYMETSVNLVQRIKELVTRVLIVHGKSEWRASRGNLCSSLIDFFNYCFKFC